MAQLFEITLEAGNLNEFDSTSGTGLSAVAPGLVATVYCMAVAISDATARYGQKTVGSDQGQVRLFLSLDTNGITMASGDVFTIALCRDNSGNDVFRVELGYDSSAGYRVRPGIRTDGGAWSDGSWVNVSDNEHILEVEWNRASGVGQNDGSIELWVEVYDVGDFGTADSSVSGVDNDTKYARVFRFGAVTGLDSGTSGTIWVDHFEANDGERGELSTTSRI
jgi:hypothetical protein